jgi:5-hydroxyisourate hydrolase-like protein (transthyretin family)
MAGITVKIEGERRTYDALTDSDGNYELMGLEPGKYKVRAVLADYYYEDEYSIREIEVNDRGCAREDFVAHNDSRIAGRIVDEEGRGVPELNVELIPVNSPDTMQLNGIDETWTDEAGQYDIDKIAPGRYLLGINITSSPTRKHPYPRTFYPGVTERSQATVINIALGQKLADINIQLSTKLNERRVQGFAVWPDGRPAANVDIHLEDVNRPGWCVNECGTKTDAQGRFTLQGFEGYTYVVQALADKSPGVMKPEPFYGQSSPIKLVSNVVGLKVVISQKGRPWDKDEKTEPVKSP